MLAEALLSERPRTKPILNPNRIPEQMYAAKSLSARVPGKGSFPCGEDQRGATTLE